MAVAGGTNDDLTFVWRAKPHRIIAAVQHKLQRLELIHQDYASRRENNAPLACSALRYPVLVAVRSGQVPARATSTDDVTVVQTATPAVVNIALWKMRPPTKAGDPPRRVKTYGSGFVIEPSGIIVTNRHVIDGAVSIKVIFDNGDQLKGELLGAAPMLDIAVLKVNADRPLPALKWGDSNSLRVGDFCADDWQSPWTRHVRLGWYR